MVSDQTVPKIHTQTHTLTLIHGPVIVFVISLALFDGIASFLNSWSIKLQIHIGTVIYISWLKFLLRISNIIKWPFIMFEAIGRQ